MAAALKPKSAKMGTFPINNQQKDKMNTQLEKTQSLTAADLFQSDTSEGIIASIRKEALAIVPDITTAKGRDAIKSQAAMVAKTKSAIEKVGKALADPMTQAVKVINVERKFYKDELDKIRDEVRGPVTEWEAEQAEIAAKIKANQENLHHVIKTVNEWGDPLPIAPLECRLDDLRDMKITKETFGENSETTYMPIRFAGINAIEAAIKAIKDAEELAELKREKEEREAKEAADAEKARIEQEAIARHEAAEVAKAIEAAIQQLKDAEELAELKREKEERQATMHDALGIAPPKATDPKRTAMNESYLSIRAVVGLSDYDTKSIVQAIADGMITNITLNY